MNSIHFLIRICPFTKKITKEKKETITSIFNNEQLYFTKENKTFQKNIEKVFDEKSNQKDVFNYFDSIINKITLGTNISLFFIGERNSGKTYTLFGEDWTINNNNKIPILEDDYNFNINNDNIGIIPRFVFKIFSFTNDDIIITINYLLIYNEVTYDLLNDKEKEEKDIINYHCSNFKEFILGLKKGEKKKMNKYINNNKMIGKSHIILKIHFQDLKNNICSNITLCELGNTEIFDKNIYFENPNSVNQSIINFIDVIRSINNNSKYIGYNQSTLIGLLKDSFQKNNNICYIFTTFFAEKENPLKNEEKHIDGKNLFKTRLKKFKINKNDYSNCSIDILLKNIRYENKKKIKNRNYSNEDKIRNILFNKKLDNIIDNRSYSNIYHKKTNVFRNFQNNKTEINFKPLFLNKENLILPKIEQIYPIKNQTFDYNVLTDSSKITKENNSESENINNISNFDNNTLDNNVINGKSNIRNSVINNILERNDNNYRNIYYYKNNVNGIDNKSFSKNKRNIFINKITNFNIRLFKDNFKNFSDKKMKISQEKKEIYTQNDNKDNNNSENNNNKNNEYSNYNEEDNIFLESNNVKRKYSKIDKIDEKESNNNINNINKKYISKYNIKTNDIGNLNNKLNQKFNEKLNNIDRNANKKKNNNDEKLNNINKINGEKNIKNENEKLNYHINNEKENIKNDENFDEKLNKKKKNNNENMKNEINIENYNSINNNIKSKNKISFNKKNNNNFDKSNIYYKNKMKNSNNNITEKINNNNNQVPILIKNNTENQIINNNNFNEDNTINESINDKKQINTITKGFDINEKKNMGEKYEEINTSKINENNTKNNLKNDEIINNSNHCSSNNFSKIKVTLTNNDSKRNLNNDELIKNNIRIKKYKSKTIINQNSKKDKNSPLNFNKKKLNKIQLMDLKEKKNRMFTEKIIEKIITGESIIINYSTSPKRNRNDDTENYHFYNVKNIYEKL